MKPSLIIAGVAIAGLIFWLTRKKGVEAKESDILAHYEEGVGVSSEGRAILEELRFGPDGFETLYPAKFTKEEYDRLFEDYLAAIYGSRAKAQFYMKYGTTEEVSPYYRGGL